MDVICMLFIALGIGVFISPSMLGIFALVMLIDKEYQENVLYILVVLLMLLGVFIIEGVGGLILDCIDSFKKTAILYLVNIVSLFLSCLLWYVIGDFEEWLILFGGLSAVQLVSLSILYIGNRRGCWRLLL